MPKLIVFIGLLGLLLSRSIDARAQALQPFSHVDDVCAGCAGGPYFDRIELNNGQEVQAVVLAENEAFYTLMRLGELRAVGRDQVRGIRRNQAAPHPSGFGDQILLVDGIVLAGTIQGPIGKEAEHFELITPNTPTPLHQVARATVAAVYRAGKRIYAADR